MHLENGAKEITEIQGKKDVRQEFSAEALAKFDQILEDDKIEKRIMQRQILKKY